MATEIASSVVGSIAGKVIDRLIDAAGRPIGYLLHYDDNIEALKMQATELAATRERIQVKIDAAQRNREIIFADAQNWIAQVDSISAAAETFLEKEVKANKRCFKGWCINLSSRLRFSKEAKKQTTTILDQLQKAPKFENVSSPAPPPGIVSSSKVFSGAFQSRQSIMSQIMEALVSDSVSIIGICGMGGVGKTTLVKEIGKKAKELKLYDAVVMAVVSQNLNILKIQAEIAHMLGFKDIPDNAELARKNSLWERIKQEKRILVILDDLWKRIELEDIGIPFGNDHQGCKIVLTSRSRDVCNRMDCQPIFTVETLSKRESWELFKELSGLVAANDDISRVAQDIADKCGGLPIAIVTMARALKNKNKHVWSDAARQLNKSLPADIEGIQGSVILSLELSYNYLESAGAKSLFLFCSLFPEDFKIPVEVLMRYGAGLRWFQNVETMEDVRARVHAVVSTLTSSFLLIEDYNEDDEECVKMHDVVRDFALIIAPKYNHLYMVRAGVGLQEWPNRDRTEDLTSISLMSNDVKEVPERLDCPKLQALLLQQNYKLVIPNSFFQEMKYLRVLDLSQNELQTMPGSLSLLENLRTLYLDRCKLGDISVIGKLGNLEILSLYGSDVKDIPTSFSQLNSLRFLDLNSCRELEVISHGIMPCFCKLEELYIDSFTHWDSEREEDLGSNARIVELQALSRLTRLHIWIPNPDILPHDLSFQNLTSFSLHICPYYLHWDIRKYSRHVTLSRMGISKIPGWIKDLLKRTECLVLKEITGPDQNILNDLVQEGFDNLKSLTIRSTEIKCLLNTLERTPNLTFHNLEELIMVSNPKLVEICHGQPPDQAFNKLRSLEVIGCNNMSNIIPSHLLQRLVNLESIEARRCRSVVHIFDCEGLGIANQETKLILPLKRLMLWDLPAMTHICNGNCQMLSFCNQVVLSVYYCPMLKKLFSPVLLQSLNLESIWIKECNSLEEIFFTKKKVEDGEKDIVLWKNDHGITFPSLRNLTSLEIGKCSKLGNLFNPFIVKSLVQLKTLQMYKCSTMQEIVINEEGENGASTERLVFPNLYYMSLHCLNSLTCFSSGSYSIEFPALEELEIYGCPKMKTFGQGDQVTPKLKAVNNLSGVGRWNGDLNTTVQQLFNE